MAPEGIAQFPGQSEGTLLEIRDLKVDLMSVRGIVYALDGVKAIILKPYHSATLDTANEALKTFCRRFFTQQFKRSCLPDGPKVGSVGVSPRGDLRMPSDACMTLWMKQLEQIQP